MSHFGKITIVPRVNIIQSIHTYINCFIIKVNYKQTKHYVKHMHILDSTI